MENRSRKDASPRRRFAGNGRRHSATRETLLRMLEAQQAPLSTGALAQATGLHENTVRSHLEQLHADGYLDREREEASGRGRPAWLWRARETEPATPYVGLTVALAEILAQTSDNPAPTAREAGRNWGRELAAGHRDEDPRTRVVDVMREQGFAPDDTGDAVVLRRCPLIDAASKHPAIVCAVHLGMIDGVAESSDARVAADLTPFTGPGECTLRMRVER